MRFKIVAVCVGIILLSAVGLSQEQPAPRIQAYSLTIIEPLPGHTHVFLPASTSVSEPTRAAGYSWHLSTPPLPFEQYLTGVPFEWKDGVQTALALLPGWPGAFGFGTNARGDVIGTANKVGPDPNTGADRVYQTPVLWRQPRMVPMNLGLLPGHMSGAAFGINSRGQVVGLSSLPMPHPFIWSDGVLSELSYPAAYPGNVKQGQANRINDKGEVAGVTGLPSPGPFEATLWNSKGVARHLGTLPGEAPVSHAYGINNKTQVVGFSVTKIPGGITRAVLWDTGTIRDLGTLGGLNSNAYAINDSGQITGVAQTSEGVSHAFVWEDGKMFDLNVLIPPTPGTVLVAAYHINNRGCISGLATVDGITRGFLLTPER